MRFGKGILASLAVTGIGAKLYYDYAQVQSGGFQMTGKSAIAKTDMQRDVVYLYAFPWIGFGQLSPFVLKTETYLRLTNTPYVRISTTDPNVSQTGRLPTMIYNGEEVPDSQYINEFIAKERQPTLDEGLTSEQHAIGHAVRRVMENSVWNNERCIMVDNTPKVTEFVKEQLALPEAIVKGVLNGFRKQIISTLNTMGNGDLTDEQYHAEYLKDIQSIETFLGDKKFVVSDEKPTSYDCNAYTILKFTQRIHDEMEVRNCPAANHFAESEALKSYVKRMDDVAFPDMSTVLETRKDAVASYLGAPSHA